jgi:Ni,Fe-hydrogenase III small subunit
MSLLKKLAQWALKKSIWIYHVKTGACNGCDIELLDILTPYYDIERFGMKAVLQGMQMLWLYQEL